MKTTKTQNKCAGNMPLWRLLAIIVIFLFSPLVKGQVTIGMNNEPEAGALLQLKDGTTSSTHPLINASKGLGLPRVELQSLTGDLGKTLDATVTTDGTLDGSKHTGLVVYNNKDNYCNTQPIFGAPYVWDGTQWLLIGASKIDAPEVETFIDNRTQKLGPQTYHNREFYYMDGATKISAGVWMTENLRFIPDPSDPAYAGVLHTAEMLPPFTNPSTGAITGPNTTKCWIYPWAESRKYESTPHPSAGTNTWICPYDGVEAEKEWNPREGILYNWWFASNRPRLNADERQGGDNENTGITYQGICPDGWHLPSDREWNELEEVIYNNPVPYSWYKTDYNFNPAKWQNTTEWEENKDSFDNDIIHRGSSTDQGHGPAMISECFGVGQGEYKGKSLSAAQGGFDIHIVGSAEDNYVRDYGRYAQLWTSSATPVNTSWRRQFYTGGGSYSKMVMRSRGGKYALYSVRCKKDGTGGTPLPNN
ncbi:hypothetical protein D0T84_21195 [Dysgonomonas sp. 521]|uniref:FISUMP domain-containing protein n=1 Tax=Dysgonomonas sp. 521 TaxID=2302932 RepID=UPI0013CF630B|nr:FISUMP domain-containing protein [Dysgonomonas sp. 521]NDV97393.1 hypothetical protein [Dysgonomonas sp. 521]